MDRAEAIRRAVEEYTEAVESCDLVARVSASVRLQGLLVDLEAAEGARAAAPAEVRE